MFLRTWRVSSLTRAGSSASLYLAFGFRQTKAQIAWPVISSLIPTTAVSAIAGCWIRADSISAVDSLCPETLMTSSTLPRIQMYLWGVQTRRAEDEACGDKDPEHQPICFLRNDSGFDASLRAEHQRVLPSYSPIVISGGSVSGEVVSLVRVHVGVEVPRMVTVDGSRDGGPWGADGEDAFLVVALDLLAALGVEQDGVDAKEGKRSRARLGSGRTRKWGDDDGAGLGLPVGVDYRALLLTDVLVVPMPRFWAVLRAGDAAAKRERKRERVRVGATTFVSCVYE